MSCCKCSLFTFVLRTCYVFLLNFFNLCDFVPFILLVPQFFPPHHSTEPPGLAVGSSQSCLCLQRAVWPSGQKPIPYGASEPGIFLDLRKQNIKTILSLGLEAYKLRVHCV